MTNNKSPDLDGFSVEFLKFVWVDICHFLLKSLNYRYRTGYLSIRERPFDFYGGQKDFLKKNNQDSDKDKQNRQDDQANKKISRTV